MPSVEQTVHTYEELAAHFDRQGEAPMRDRYLVLAADTALTGGKSDDAERLRARLLHFNPHHLLRPFASMPEAMQSADVQSYVNGLRRSYPSERAAQLLESLRTVEVGKPAAASLAGATVPDKATEAPGVLKVYRGQETDAKSASAPVAARGPSLPKAPAAAPAVSPIQAVKLVPKAETPPSDKPTYPMAPEKPSPPVPPVSRPAPRTAAKPLPPTPDAKSANATVATPHEDREGPTGAWVSSALFGVVLLGGILLAWYTLARPFLP